MPTSVMSQVSSIMSIVERVNPERMIDVGAGCGKYGFLCREMLEVYFRNKPSFSTLADSSRKGSSVTIDAVEAYENYITPLHRFIYNTIHIGDALSVFEKMAEGSYDLVLSVDVLEHFSKRDGIKFLSECSRIGRTSIIATPKQVAEQDAVHGNQWENHRSSWSATDLRKAGACFVMGTEQSWVGVFGSSGIGGQLAWESSWRRYIPDFPGKKYLASLRRSLFTRSPEEGIL